MRLAFFGGLYSNYLSLSAALRDAQGRRADRIFCLGDLGAFGPHPDRVFPLLHEHDVECIQGNYDHSIGNSLNDCQCGYTDPRDNHFARISYDYTFERTSENNRRWLQQLPPQLRFEADGLRFLLCHGGPRKTNEFLWESTTSTQFLQRLANDHAADVILGTHTGIHWQRDLSLPPSPANQSQSHRPLHRWRGVGGEGHNFGATPSRRFINVGVLGRPENDGRTNVWYTLVRTGPDAANPASNLVPQIQNPKSKIQNPPLSVDFIPVHYDHHRLAAEMRAEQLPGEFIETILTGWWTTCLEVLPAKERRRGRY
jgi:predicted phosphodiesterase